MYTCGPTVYDFAHIGNFRTFVFYDLLRRWLRASGFQLNHVMNITDVDDKIIRNAVAQGKSLRDYTDNFTQAFLDDCGTLRLERPEHIVRATDHINEMAESIAKLEADGFTYRSDGSVYFRIAKFAEYGKLSHNDFSGMVAGARVDVDEYEKADARDFALWKAPKEGEPNWETCIGPGRPGWHIECSVMAYHYLGATLDLHAGGVDLIFPHHENEIAQSEALTGKPFATFWVHSEFLLVDGQKMSKSLGNFYTLRDLFGRGFTPESVRYLLASVPYRKGLNFTFDGLTSAKTAIDRLRNFKLRLETAKLADGLNEELEAKANTAHLNFRAGMDDDLNTAIALTSLETLLGLKKVDVAQQLAAIAEMDAVLGINLMALSRTDLRTRPKTAIITEDEIESALAARKEARVAKDFAKSDIIRDDLIDKGVEVMDGDPLGWDWRLDI